MPILTRDPDGPYYSRGDEDAFFEWLKRIKCVTKFEGSGTELRIHVRSKRISNQCLNELIGIFKRYTISMRQLAQFENESNRTWLRNPDFFWHREMFGPETKRVSTRRNLKKRK